MAASTDLYSADSRTSNQKRTAASYTGISQVDWSNDQEVIDFVYSCWDLRKSTKQILEREWAEQIAWLMGDQTYSWDPERKALTPPTDDPAWRIRLVVNLILPEIEKKLAKLTRIDPEWDVRPFSGEYNDVAAARIGRKLLQQFWYMRDMGGSLEEALFWMFGTGNVVLKTVWDAKAGSTGTMSAKQLAGPLTGDEGADSENLHSAMSIMRGLEGRKGRHPGGDDYAIPMSMGDVGVEVCEPFGVTTDPEATDIDIQSCDWVLHSKRRPVTKIRERYGAKAKDVKPTSLTTDDPELYLYYRVKSFESGQGTMATDRTTVHELRIPPLPGVKNQIYVVCQGKMMAKAPSPFHDGRYGMRILREVPVSGKMWGTSTVAQLMTEQADYNDTRSQMAENRQSMGNPVWMNPQGSNVDENDLTDEPGLVINHTMGYGPTREKGPELPRYVSDQLRLIDSEVQNITGQHEVSRGQVPGEVKSGAAIRTLVAQDDTRIGLLGRRLDRFMSGVGQDILELYCLKVPEYRIGRLADDDGLLDTFYFTGQDLAGGRENRAMTLPMDVRVSSYSRLPLNRDAVSNMMLTLVQNGILGPQHTDAILESMQIGTALKVMDKKQPHRSRAHYENRTMATGEPILPTQAEDHGIHIEIHKQFRNSEEYRRLPKEIRALFEMHQRMHKKMGAIEMVEPEALLMEARDAILARMGASPEAAGMQGPQAGPPGRQGQPRGPAGEPASVIQANSPTAGQQGPAGLM